VDILRLDEIPLAGECEWQSLNYTGGPNVVKIAIVRDANVLLFQSIMDWSRLNGDVISQQIVWSGNFENCQWILQVLEDNSDTPNTLTLAREVFPLHPELREQHIIRHSIHCLVACIAAIAKLGPVFISLIRRLLEESTKFYKYVLEDSTWILWLSTLSYIWTYPLAQLGFISIKRHGSFGSAW
jgi:hypothetical protein